jgi:hypothetical protein
LKLKEVKVIDYNMENLVSKPDFWRAFSVISLPPVEL